MGLFSKKQARNESGQKKGFNVYSLITSLATVVLFVALGLIVLWFRQVIPFSSGFLLAVLTMIIVSGAAILALPWIRRLQNRQHKIVSWVYIGLLILCAVFWLIFVFLVVINFDQLTENASKVIHIINFLKFTLIYTMNYAIASLIATNILKYGKSLIPFQIILYLSNLFVDIYATLLFCCIHFNENSFVSFSMGTLSWLINPVVLTIFSIAFVYMIVANVIARRIERRRMRYAADDYDVADGRGNNQPKAATAQEKLAELKSMLDQNLITQEEYEAKKNDILSKM